MRLTYKETSCGFDFYKLKPDVGEDAKAQKWNYYDALNKLGQLEDIEEEFGIDLITLFKVLKNGIWHKKFNKILYVEPENIYIDNEMTFYTLNGYCIEGIAKYNDPIFKWAFTKEELE